MHARLVLARATQIVLRNGSRCSASRLRSDVTRVVRSACSMERVARSLATPVSTPLLPCSTDHDRSRRRLRRARLRGDAVRQGRRRARRLGHVLLRVREPPHARCSSSASSATTTRWTSSSRSPAWRRPRGARAGGRTLVPVARTLPARPQLRPRRSRRTSACSRISARRSRRSSARRPSSSSATSIRDCSSTC